MNGPQNQDAGTQPITRIAEQSRTATAAARKHPVFPTDPLAPCSRHPWSTRRRASLHRARSRAAVAVRPLAWAPQQNPRQPPHGRLTRTVHREDCYLVVPVSSNKCPRPTQVGRCLSIFCSLRLHCLQVSRVYCHKMLLLALCVQWCITRLPLPAQKPHTAQSSRTLKCLPACPTAIARRKSPQSAHSATWTIRRNYLSG